MKERKPAILAAATSETDTRPRRLRTAPPFLHAQPLNPPRFSREGVTQMTYVSTSCSDGNECVDRKQLLIEFDS
jgi:hypothetical protein